MNNNNSGTPLHSESGNPPTGQNLIDQTSYPQQMNQGNMSQAPQQQWLYDPNQQQQLLVNTPPNPLLYAQAQQAQLPLGTALFTVHQQTDYAQNQNQNYNQPTNPQLNTLNQQMQRTYLNGDGTPSADGKPKPVNRRPPISISVYRVHGMSKDGVKAKAAVALGSQGQIGKMSTTTTKLTGDRVFITWRPSAGGRLMFQRTETQPNWFTRDRVLNSNFLVAVDPAKDMPHPFIQNLMNMNLIEFRNEHFGNRTVASIVTKSTNDRNAPALSASLASILSFEFLIKTQLGRTTNKARRVLSVTPIIEKVEDFTDVQMRDHADNLFNLAQQYGNFIFAKLRREFDTQAFADSSVSITHELAFLLPFAVLAGDQFFTYACLMCTGPYPVMMTVARLSVEYHKHKNERELIYIVGVNKTMHDYYKNQSAINVADPNDTIDPNHILLRANQHLIGGIHGYKQPVMHINGKLKRERDIELAGQKKTFKPFPIEREGFVVLAREMVFAENDTSSMIGDTVRMNDFFDDELALISE